MDRDILIQAEEIVARWDRTMILSHDRPDGDALGAIGAAQQVITALGRSATAFVYDEVPNRYRCLSQLCTYTPWPADSIETLDGQVDGILILDTCAWSQLDTPGQFLRQTALPKVVIDHHATRDDLGEDTTYIVDPTAASACGLVLEWLEALNWPMPPTACEALFAGIMTDTGWLRFSNTDARTMHQAARLIDRGVSPDVLYGHLFASHSTARVRLLAETLATLELHADDRLAVMNVTQAMFDRTGAAKADTEDLINEPLNSADIIASVLLSDLEPGVVRVSFRSKSPEVCGLEIDVAAVARQFGGGGHHRAAGARIEGTLADAKQQVIAAMTNVLNR